MSFMAKRYLRKFRAEDYKKSVAHSFIKPNQKINLFRKNENEYKIDPVKKGQLVTIDTVADPTSQILYFHGGAFTVPMNEDQLEMMTQIAQAANSRLQIADFPLLPTNSADDMLAFSQAVFDKVVTDDLPLFIVADSAGAKLALQLLMDNPGKVLGTSLISPWLDMKLTDPEIAKRAENDILLDLPTLQEIGGWFTDGASAEKWQDVFNSANLKNIGDVQIFYGENEMLVPSDLKLIDAMGQAEGASPLPTTFKDAWHDYTLWFKLSETKKTFRQIAEFIKDRRGA